MKCVCNSVITNPSTSSEAMKTPIHGHRIKFTKIFFLYYSLRVIVCTLLNIDACIFTIRMIEALDDISIYTHRRNCGVYYCINKA